MKIQLRLFFTLLIGLVFLLTACGGSSSSEEKEHEASEEHAAASVAVSDPEAKSESKGVGKFTAVQIGELDKAMAEKGQAVFEAKCASCHKVTDEKFVGPGLKDVTERRTPEWVLNMITNPEEMTKNDPVGKALLEKHLVQMTFQNVSDEQAREILEYFRKNDHH
ncbi:MAG TPA: cytochrome c [Daejeonella sp.]|nr:cytochrome c [Daejeonella sp.]